MTEADFPGVTAITSARAAASSRRTPVSDPPTPGRAPADPGGGAATGSLGALGRTSAVQGPQLADTVARLRRAMRRAARVADPGNPLAVAQLELLSAVADEPGVRPGELARRLRLAPNSVTTLVNGLHARGLIIRTSDGRDARVVNLTLTDTGRDVVDDWRATNTAVIEAALSTLSTRDHQALTEALGALRELTRAVDALADTPPEHAAARAARAHAATARPRRVRQARS